MEAQNSSLPNFNPPASVAKVSSMTKQKAENDSISIDLSNQKPGGSQLEISQEQQLFSKTATNEFHLAGSNAINLPEGQLVSNMLDS